MKKVSRVGFTCGGTGGHLYPAIAVAQVLRDKGVEAWFFMANDREDMAHVQTYGMPACAVGPSRGGAMAVCLSIYSAWRHLREIKPDMLVCTGGKITFAVAIAAKLCGIPVVVMEQNAVPGRANRVIAKLAQHVFLTFPESRGYFPDRCTLMGNPVRIRFPEDARLAALMSQRMSGVPTVLVLGGSQGATALNRCVLASADAVLDAFPANWIVLTGQRFADSEGLPETGVWTRGQRCVIHITYCEAMDQLYQASDVVVSRAGATTIAEILAFAKPAVVIPYPYAKDNHQEANARALCQKPGYTWIAETALSGTRLVSEIQRVVGVSPERDGVSAAVRIAGWILGDR